MKTLTEAIQCLKTVPSGEMARDALRKRMSAGLNKPKIDPMVRRALPIVHDYKPTGRILDVGCYTGWLYHYLGKPEGYVGIDIWKEAIEVAKEFSPEADFRECNLLDMEGDFDTVWCVQIPWGRTQVKAKDAVEKIRTLGKRCVIALTTYDACGFDIEMKGYGDLAVWEEKGVID